MNIVGIAGLPRSGKDSLAELFMEHGYFGVSLGDIIRDASRERHADTPDPISVKNMTETSNYLRSTYGADFALKEALKRFEEAQKQQDYSGLVVYSVRAPVEADFIVEKGGRLIWVEASDEVRYERAVKYQRQGEVTISLEEMKQQEALQEVPQPGKPAEIQMNTSYVRSVATDVIENNGDNFEAFKAEAKQTFGLI